MTLGVGPPDYMSPELLGMDGSDGSSGAADDFIALKQRREGKYDAKACDVWALGVLLYLAAVNPNLSTILLLFIIRA